MIGKEEKNMNETIKLRTARPDDAEELLKIYAPYVENTAITFEYEVPSVAEFRARIENTLKKYPYIVAERGGELLGYAYTGPFRSRAAYDWAAETSIYVKEGQKGLGLGRKLYEAIETISRMQNILNLNACIAYPKVDDEYLTKNSAQFHEHLGFKYVGEFHDCAYKFGRWYDMIWMELSLGEHIADPAAVVAFCDLDKRDIEKIM